MPSDPCTCDESEAGTVTIRAEPDDEVITLKKGESETQVVSFCQPGNSQEIIVPVTISGPSGPGVPPNATTTSHSADRLRALYAAIQQLNESSLVVPLQASLGEDGALIVKGVCKFDIRAGDAAAKAVKEGKSGPTSGLSWGGPIIKLWFRFHWTNSKMRASIPKQWGGTDDRAGIVRPLPPHGSGQRVMRPPPHEGIRIFLKDWQGAVTGPMKVAARQRPHIALHIVLFGNVASRLWWGELRQVLPASSDMRIARLLASAFEEMAWRYAILDPDSVIVYGPEDVRVMALDCRLEFSCCSARSVHIEVGSPHTQAHGRLGQLGIARVPERTSAPQATVAPSQPYTSRPPHMASE